MKPKHKSGTITELEKNDALSIANSLLEKVKRSEKNKKAVRVNKTTIILVKNSLSEIEVNERVSAFEKRIEYNKTFKMN